MKKILFPILILGIILGMSDCKEEENGEEGENGKGKETYYTVTYHKNTKYNNYSNELEFRNGEIKDEDVTGEPPVDPTHYKTGEKIKGEAKLTESGQAIFKGGVGSGTLELEGYEIIGWARRLDVNDVSSPFYGYKGYTENEPVWFPPVPRGGWEVYHNNIDLDPIWRRKRPAKE